MVFHFTRLEAKRQRKVFLGFYEVENFDCRENQTKGNLFNIHPSIYFTNSYLHGTLPGEMGKPLKSNYLQLQIILMRHIQMDVHNASGD